jgi:hypothetical protein
VSFHLGLLCALLRRLPESFEHLEDSIEQSARMRDRPWYVMSQFAFAVALLLRREAGDVERAYSLLDEARASAQQMGLRSPLDRPLARLFFVLAEERGIREEVESVLLDESDAPGPDDALRAQQPGKIKLALRRRGLKQLSKMVADATDEELEERFQSRPVQRALFTAAAMTFVPEKAYGFQGTIAYELTCGPDLSGCVREPDHWTITITGDKATARRGKASSPAVSVRIGLADFVRVAAGEMNPVKAMLAGRIEVEGDVAVAGRLVEMFGGAPE